MLVSVLVFINATTQQNYKAKYCKESWGCLRIFLNKLKQHVRFSTDIKGFLERSE